MFKRSEYERWIIQAEKILRSALRDLEGGDYEWASFEAQQAAELAVKAPPSVAGLRSHWALHNPLAEKSAG